MDDKSPGQQVFFCKTKINISKNGHVNSNILGQNERLRKTEKHEDKKEVLIMFSDITSGQYLRMQLNPYI